MLWSLFDGEVVLAHPSERISGIIVIDHALDIFGVGCEVAEISGIVVGLPVSLWNFVAQVSGE